jgi:hypothetical protein
MGTERSDDDRRPAGELVAGDRIWWCGHALTVEAVTRLASKRPGVYLHIADPSFRLHYYADEEVHVVTGERPR